MKTKAFWAGFCLLLLSGCGPIIGGMMVASTGVKDFTVVRGDLEGMRPGAKLAVLGPFATTAESFYICRGEEAANFTTEFNQLGLFQAELSMASRFPEQPIDLGVWAGRQPAEVARALSLKAVPEWLMTGTILHRQMVAAPAQGVIMHVTYRLEFLELGSGQTVILEVAVKELFQDAVPATVEDLARRLGGTS